MSTKKEGFFKDMSMNDQDSTKDNEVKPAQSKTKPAQNGFFNFAMEESTSDRKSIDLEENKFQESKEKEAVMKKVTEISLPSEKGLNLKVDSVGNDQIKSGSLVTPQITVEKKKKKEFNLFLPVDIISKEEKEAAFPTDGNSQKKKQNVFNFYDNFHEYTVFCDVAMKKCSRNSQEDRFSAISPLDLRRNTDSFFAVFDGHGTSAIAEILKENLHTYICKNPHYPTDIHLAVKESFQKIDDEILKKQKDNQMVSGGSTALCCLIHEDKLYVINCGDSSSVLVTNDYQVQFLNSLHKPSLKEEAERLQQKDALFTQQRVFGTLAITRALGDYKLKEYIISEPEIKVYTIDENSKYCFLGTDGFWDIIDYKKELPGLLKARDSQFDGERSNLKDLSTFLVEIASNRTTQSKKDNMTLLAIDLNWFYRQNSEVLSEDEGMEISDHMLLSKGGNSFIMCSKSQFKFDKEISSFLLQAKAPLSGSRRNDKMQLSKSLNNSKQVIIEDGEGARTCLKKPQGMNLFFSTNSDEEPNQITQTTSVYYIPTPAGHQTEEMSKLDGAITATKGEENIFGSVQNPMTVSQTLTSSITLQKSPSKERKEDPHTHSHHHSHPPPNNNNDNNNNNNKNNKKKNIKAFDFGEF